MYKCEFCKVIQEANVPEVRVLVESRPRTYINKYFIDKDYLEKESHGWEIAKESKVCPTCASNQIQNS